MSRYSKTRLRKGGAKAGPAKQSLPGHTGTTGQEEAMLLGGDIISRIEHPAPGEWSLKTAGNGKRDR